MKSSNAPVTVLLATYNGAAFLEAQLRSLAAQTVERIDVRVSDDGSHDDTQTILSRWALRWTKGRFDVVDGPRLGFAENFRALLGSMARTEGYVACCDQDDEWDADKLDVAIAALTAGDDSPAAYFSRTRLTDADGRAYGLSPLFRRPPGLGNALVQSIGGGNTMVLNPAGARLVAESCRRTGFVSHDWWAYLLITAAGGRVIYDPVPHLGYRQHGGNVMGNNVGVGARLRRVHLLLGGRFRQWTEENLAGLSACEDLLSRQTVDMVRQLRRVRASRSPLRVVDFVRLGLYRQTMAGNISLILAALIGRI